MPYKVMLVDDDSLVRRGLKSFVDWEKKGLVLAGEAADGGAPVYSAAATKRKGGAKRGTAPIPENC